MSRLRILCGLVSIIVLTSSSAWAQAPTAGSMHSCEYAEGASAPVRGNVPFPDGDLFRPILADPKEPRVSFQFLRFRPDGASETTNVGAISAGGVVGVWARRALKTCDGVQVSLIGGVFSDFNLDADSRDLINSDFLLGGQIATRGTGISGRIRVIHQSSHLGEDQVFLKTVLPNFGYQGIDGLVSVDRPWWRLYGGAGYLYYLHDQSTSGMLQAGAELRSELRAKGVIRPVVGVNVLSLQARSWGLGTSALFGLEWTSPAASRRIRGSILYADGYTSFGQFSLQQKARTFGLQLQIEF